MILESRAHAGSISVWEKSLPIKSSGSSARFAKAYERKSAKFSAAGSWPLP